MPLVVPQQVMLYLPQHIDVPETTAYLTAVCEQQGWRIVSVDPDSRIVHRTWWDTVRAAHDSGAEIILAAHESHVPADRTPRLVIADLLALPQPGPAAPPRSRRPRPV